MQIEETYQQKDDPAVTCTARELHGVKKGLILRLQRNTLQPGQT